MADNDFSDATMENYPRFNRDADKGREPELLPGQMGQRRVSVQALIERIERAFADEHAEGSSVLIEADTPVKKIKLLLGTIDYVLAVEAIQPAREEKAALIQKVYSAVFGYGPLDALFLDARVTTISLDGPNKAAIRYDHGDMTSIGPIFQDEVHLKRILSRLLADAGAELQDDQPFVETGLVIEGRPVCVSLAAPPLNLNFSADIRLHPKTPITLVELETSQVVTHGAVQLLDALAQSQHGIVVVGDTEAGKTTLLGVIATLLSRPDQIVSVERAGELRLPEGAQRFVVRWPAGEQPGASFGEQIDAALASKPGCILLDEIRSDEPQSIMPLLSMADPPRQLWSFRGPTDPKRLRSALTMLARRADMNQSEALVNALYQRLPFVLTTSRREGRIRLHSVAEWQFRTPEFPDYVQLMRLEDGELKLTGERPSHDLALPDDFWTTA